MGLSFLSPLLLGGAALVAAPIILHMVMRRTPVPHAFPALRFLKERAIANRRRLQLSHLLLLLVRIAALLLLTLALARPVLRGAGWLPNAEGPVAAALVFDTAPRMTLREGNKTRLQQAAELARVLLGKLPAGSEVAVFDTAGGRGPATPAAGEGPDGPWSWRDLLTSIDVDESDSESLAERMAAEIIGMGIDPAALLPRGRIDEIAMAVQTRDAAGAREIVRRLAPAAIRRLVRRLFSDAAMRGQSDRFLQRFGGMIEEAAERDRGGLLVATLLATDGGRAWLLLAAAAGDLG
jgi:hypothetical protein